MTVEENNTELHIFFKFSDLDRSLGLKYSVGYASFVYSRLTVGNESSDYIINYLPDSSLDHDFKDMLPNHQPFRTYDRNQQSTEEKYFKPLTSGWWGQCENCLTASSPFINYHGPTVPYLFPPINLSFDKLVMMIRPENFTAI